jgi:hypothetical protein
LKVARNTVGGYRNSVTFVLTGLDIAEKTDLALRSLFAAAPRERFDTVDVALSGPAMLIDDPVSNDEAMAHLRVTVTSSDATIVGRQFSNAAVELALANYPGFFTTSPPADASPFGVYSPASIERADVVQVLVTDEGRHVVPDAPCTAELQWTPDAPGSNDAWPGATSRVPLGWIAGARSGDKGGDANVGVWVRTDAAYRWLAANLTTDLFRFLVSEAESLEVRRYLLPNLRAVNFVVVGLLGRGVAASTRTDAQAKGLGEFLRARHVDIPVELLDS